MVSVRGHAFVKVSGGQGHDHADDFVKVEAQSRATVSADRMEHTLYASIRALTVCSLQCGVFFSMRRKLTYFRIVADGADITSLINDCLLLLPTTDKPGIESEPASVKSPMPVVMH